jgi:hypothetical protein
MALRVDGAPRRWRSVDLVTLALKQGGARL